MNKLFVSSDGVGNLIGRAEGWTYYMFASADSMETLFLRLRVQYNATCSGWDESNTEVIEIASFYDGKNKFNPPYEVSK